MLVIIHYSFSSSAQRLREALALALIALLPFHALLVTVLTRLIAGSDHAPLAWLAVWKEGVLGVTLLVALVEMVHRVVRTSGQLSAPKSPATRLDVLDVLILALLALSVLVTTFTHQNWMLYLFGFRYDFVPLVAFMILRRADWSDAFLPRALQTILWSGVLVAAYAVFSFVLPAAFFHWLGYADLHSLYVPGKPLAAFQLIGETALRRVQGPMSGPNQLGLWMLLPIAVCVSQIATSGWRNMRRLGLLMLFGAALLLSFSRAAWIGAFVIGCIALWPVVRSLSRKASIGIAFGVTAFVVVLASLFPSVIVRLSSSRGHLQGPLEALQYMIDEPFGRGMGMAGPASNRVSDACVFLRETDDPSWAADRSDLCVFLGDVQVQPVDHACACPFLPENWYLQIGVEMGWLGMALYLALVVLVLWRLSQPERNMKNAKFSILNSQFSILLSFLALSIAALFLHAFEDAAVSYTLWMLAAVALAVRAKRAL